ncbi:MAG: T9SS type A sorting domain-containing protein, partial [Flavobacteriaceae bacterium]|nr:T9SS type A sorting domain-containing protein [Flavobacteriaceae bacterium]
SWTRHVVDSFQRANKVSSATPIRGNNGTVEVLVDNAGHVHVFYPWLGNFYDTVVNGADARYVQYGTGVDGIIHWSDYDDSSHYLGGMIDGNNDGTLDIGTQTRSRDWGGYGDALSFTQGGATVTFAALTTMPSASIDASGKIFLTYTSVVEGDLSVDDENYRDIYVVWSGDNGKTWSTPQNITGTVGKEEIFPCQARMVDDRIRVMYEEQDDPGISVNEPNNAAQSDMPIKYFEVMTADILKGDIGVKGAEAISTFRLGQNQPNPANGLTTIPLNLFRTSDVRFTITDVTGKQILTENFHNMNAGTNYLTVDASSLSSGVYFYQVKAGSYSSTQKMIVE